jgi:hypothetical protein
MRVVLVLLGVLLLVLAFAAGFVVHGLVLRQLGNDVLEGITTPAATAAHP